MANLMNLTGFREMAAKMRELGPRVARNTLRRATSSGAAVIRNDVRARAPTDTGEMKRDIQIKRSRDTNGEMSAKYAVYVRVGAKSRLSGRARNVAKDSFYWIFNEFGTAKMAANPFMRPAFEAQKQAAVNKIGETLDEGIQKAARDLAVRR